MQFSLNDDTFQRKVRELKEILAQRGEEFTEEEVAIALEYWITISADTLLWDAEDYLYGSVTFCHWKFKPKKKDEKSVV